MLGMFWKEKIGRVRFVILFFSVSILSVSIAIALDKAQFGWTSVIIWVVAVSVKVVLAKQRLNDIGKKGKEIYYLFVPIVNIFVLLYLLFKKGSCNIDKLINAQEEKIDQFNQRL